MLVFCQIKCAVSKKNNKWKLEVKLSGEEIDPQKHNLKADIKAVTKHLFEIEQLSNKTFRCQVVLDV